MKRVLNGVQVLMAVGLIVALAACSGSDNGSIKMERDDALAVAAAAEAAAEAAKAEAEAAKVQAALDKAAAEAAAAEVDAAKAAQAAAEAAQEAAEAALAGAPRPVADLIADLVAANNRLAAATTAVTDAEAAHAAATAAREAAQAALGDNPEDLTAAIADFAARAEEETAAATAVMEAHAERVAATTAQQAAQDAVAGTPRHVDELEAELETAKMTLADAMTALTEADTMLAAATAMREAAQAAVNAEPEDLDAAITALQDAITAEEMAMGAQVAAQAAVANAQATVDVADAAVKAADQGPSSADLAAIDTANAREAFKVLAAIKTTADDDPDTDDLHQVRKADDSIKAKHSGTAVTLSATNSDKTVGSFAAADVNKAPAIYGWESATLTAKRKLGGTGASNSATAMVYSNIEAPEYKLFAVVYGKTAKLAIAIPVVGSVTVAMANSRTDDRWEKLVKIPPANSYFGATDGGSVTGTFDGVAGTFVCTATCPTDNFPTRRSDGSIIAAATGEVPHAPGGTWEFTATDKDAMVKIADSDYLSFGYWLSKNSTGVPQEFRVMYSGSKSVAAAVATLDESVTYKGVAGGKYVKKDDVDNTATAGYFTATAELTADFREENIGLNRGNLTEEGHGKLTGSISAFKEGDASPLGDLKLSLSGVLRYGPAGQTNVPFGLNVRTDDYDHDGDTGQDGATGLRNTNTVKATTNSVPHGIVGAWEASLFGAEKHTNLPTGVAGAFNAEIPSQAVVVGGFGATKVEE